MLGFSQKKKKNLNSKYMYVYMLTMQTSAVKYNLIALGIVNMISIKSKFLQVLKRIFKIKKSCPFYAEFET